MQQNRDQSRDFSLSDGECRYLLSGDSGGYSSSKLDARIEEKRISKLDKRLQYLIDDLVLVEQSDEFSLTSEQWEEMSQQLSECNPRIEQRNKEVSEYSNSVSDTATQTGFLLGQVADILSTNSGLPIPDLVWGFILALNGTPKDTQKIPKKIDLDEFSHTWAEHLLLGGLEQTMKKKHHERLYNRIDEPVIELFDVSRFHKIRKIIEDCVTPDLYAGPRLLFKIYKRVDQSEHPINPQKVERAIHNLKLETDLDASCALWHAIQHDRSYLANKSWRKLSYDYTFLTIWKMVSGDVPGDSAIRSDQRASQAIQKQKIIQEFDEPVGQVTKVLNDLADVGKDEYSWKGYPVIREVEDGRYSTTPYGKLVGLSFFDDEIQKHIQNYAIVSSHYSGPYKILLENLLGSFPRFRLDIDYIHLPTPITNSVDY